MGCPEKCLPISKVGTPFPAQIWLGRGVRALENPDKLRDCMTGAPVGLETCEVMVSRHVTNFLKLYSCWG